MEKIDTRLTILMILLFFVTINTCNTCKTMRQNDYTKQTLDSLKSEMVNQKQIETMLKIEGYEISKRLVYDENAIVRTAVRPDDKMKEYDDLIQKLKSDFKNDY